MVTTTSIGIALARGPHDRPETLLRDADAAMYRAKERGRARTEVFDPALRSHVVVRLETERALRHALDRDELRVLYQPTIRLADGELVGAEALLRWRHPARGLIGPQEFIGVAEETGLIVSIGEWVIEQACAELARQRVARAGGPVMLSVNLSGRQLARPELVESIRTRLAAAGLAPSLLCLEVTESVLLDDVDTSVTALRGLKDLGVRLAVDDFGTGFSSLGYLKQFPFDQLKIDQAFVAGLGSSDADDAIVLAASQMAHTLGMEVVAEGVETELQRRPGARAGLRHRPGLPLAPPGRAEDLLGRPAPLPRRLDLTPGASRRITRNGARRPARPRPAKTPATCARPASREVPRPREVAMRSFVKEFKEFISRGNVLDLAVGIVIGIAFTTVVNSFVNDILNAFVGAVVGKPNFDNLTVTIGDGVIRYGAFLTAVVNFVIVAFALFVVVKAFNTFRRKEEPEPEHTEKDVLIEIRDLLATGASPAPPPSRAAPPRPRRAV